MACCELHDDNEASLLINHDLTWIWFAGCSHKPDKQQHTPVNAMEYITRKFKKNIKETKQLLCDRLNVDINDYRIHSADKNNITDTRRTGNIR